MDNNKNNFNHWLIILAVLVLAAFLPLSFKQFANALSSNYSKSAGSQLTVTDWNNLPADFVARTGGATSAMQGNLDMGNHQINNLSAPTVNGDAVNMGAMNTAIAAAVAGASSINDTSGNNLRMVCGRSGTVGWTFPFADRIARLEVNTSAAGFTSDNVTYFASLGGNTQHFYTKGATSIYNPDRDSFVVYIVYEWIEDFWAYGPEDWGWYINWCGVAN